MIGCGGAFGQCSRSGVEIAAANLGLSTCAGANGDRAAGRTAGHSWSQEEEEGNTQQDMLVLASLDTTLAKFEETLSISTAEVLPLWCTQNNYRIRC